MGNLSDQLTGKHQLGVARQLAAAVCIHQQKGIVIPAKGVRADVADQQRHAFAHPLSLCLGQQVMALSGETDAIQSAAATTLRLGDSGKNVWVFDKLDGRWQTGRGFLDFCAIAAAGRQSATAAQAMKTVALAISWLTAASISSAERTFQRWTPRGVSKLTGPATKLTCAPASRAARAKAKPIFHSTGW